MIPTATDIDVSTVPPTETKRDWTPDELTAAGWTLAAGVWSPPALPPVGP